MNEIEQMTDHELHQFAEQAKADLYRAAEEQANSEWHQACFAAVLAVGMELNLRQAHQKPAGYLQ